MRMNESCHTQQAHEPMGPVYTISSIYVYNRTQHAWFSTPRPPRCALRVWRDSCVNSMRNTWHVWIMCVTCLSVLFLNLSFCTFQGVTDLCDTIPASVKAGVVYVAQGMRASRWESCAWHSTCVNYVHDTTHVVRDTGRVWIRVAVCCSVLQCVAACCSVLQRVAACCSVICAWHDTCVNSVCELVLQCVAVCCSVLQRVAACCSVICVWHDTCVNSAWFSPLRPFQLWIIRDTWLMPPSRWVSCVARCMGVWLDSFICVSVCDMTRVIVHVTWHANWKRRRQRLCKRVPWVHVPVVCVCDLTC